MNVFYVNVILCFEALATDISPAGQNGLILLSALSLVLKGTPQLQAALCFLIQNIFLAPVITTETVANSLYLHTAQSFQKELLSSHQSWVLIFQKSAFN